MYPTAPQRRRSPSVTVGSDRHPAKRDSLQHGLLHHVADGFDRRHPHRGNVRAVGRGRCLPDTEPTADGRGARLGKGGVRGVRVC